MIGFVLWTRRHFTCCVHVGDFNILESQCRELSKNSDYPLTMDLLETDFYTTND